MLEDYDIRLCKKSEVSELQFFIDQFWEKNHALAVSRELLDWQHYDRSNGCYNFVIAKHRKSKEIHSILGFIPTSQFDPSLKDNRDAWAAIWRAREGIGASGLAIFVFYHLMKILSPKNLSAFGMNRRVVPINKILGKKMGLLRHFYMINRDKKNLNLVANFNRLYISLKARSSPRKKILPCDKNNLKELGSGLRYPSIPNQVPLKSLLYLHNRYLAHPIYRYEAYAISEDAKIGAIFIIREVAFQSNRALRIVDYYGNPAYLSGATEIFQELLRHHDAEYIDLYHLGFDETLLAKAGFLERKPTSRIVIPNHYEPFERKNINLDFVIFTDDSSFHTIMVKGDCDQDRPNMIVGKGNPEPRF